MGDMISDLWSFVRSDADREALVMRPPEPLKSWSRCNMIATDLKAKRGKCLALVAVLAMAACAFAIALPAGDSDADTRTATATALSDASGLSEKGGDYYVAKLDHVSDVTGTEGMTYNIYLLDAASVSFADSVTGTFNLYFASAVDTSKTADNVTFMWGLMLVGVAGNTYMADAMDDDNTVADRIIVASADEQPGEGSIYGVIVHDQGTTLAYCYCAGTDVGEVNLTDTGDGVMIINGSATVNAVYEDDDGVEHVNQTITATDILVADVTKPVMIEVTDDMVEAFTTDSFTVSGGDADGDKRTTGSITIDKNRFSIAYEDLDGLAMVLNGYYTDGALSARAETGEADPAAVTVVFGSVANPGAALSHVGGVIFVNTTVEEVKVGSESNIVTLSLTGGIAKVDDGTIYDIIRGDVELVSGTFTAPRAANTEAEDDDESADFVPYGASLTVMADATLELTDDVVVSGTMIVYGTLSTLDGKTYVLAVMGADATETAPAEIAVLKAYSGSKIDSGVSIIDSGISTDVNLSASTDNGDKKGSSAAIIAIIILIVIIVIIVALKMKKDGKF